MVRRQRTSTRQRPAWLAGTATESEEESLALPRRVVRKGSVEVSRDECAGQRAVCRDAGKRLRVRGPSDRAQVHARDPPWPVGARTPAHTAQLRTSSPSASTSSGVGHQNGDPALRPAMWAGAGVRDDVRDDRGSVDGAPVGLLQ